MPETQLPRISDRHNFNLGPLRSTSELTLHTHHAANIWRGRRFKDPAEKIKDIIGMTGFAQVTNIVKHRAAANDPYADGFMIQLDDKLRETEKRLSALRQEIHDVLLQLPEQITVSKNLNVQPVKLPLFISSAQGYQAMYALIHYDELIRDLLLANHIGLLGRQNLETCIDRASSVMRSLFGLAQRYKNAGVSRDDMVSRNARALEAIEKFGELPQDILEGTRRSEYAPPIHAPATSIASDVAEEEEEAPESLSSIDFFSNDKEEPEL